MDKKNNGVIKTYEILNYMYYGLYIILVILTLFRQNEKVQKLLEKFNSPDVKFQKLKNRLNESRLTINSINERKNQ